MKKVIFLISHIGSGSDALYALLNNNPRIMGYENADIYENNLSLFALIDKKHKLNNSSRIYMDHLLYNYQYCLKPDPLIQMIASTRNDRQIALLRIPQLQLQLKFINLADHQIQALLERFDLYTRRGGG